MAPTTDATLPPMRRARKSIGTSSLGRKAHDKENATIDLGSASATNRKSRSKSMGPGGLDALQQASGNRRASLAAPLKPRSILKPTIAALPEIPLLKKKLLPDAPARSSSLSSANDDSSGSKIALRTEEEQQAAARERDERQRRDARRKSLANRRVSFAAEATLHTFSIPDFQDTTASSEASRRASAKAAAAAESDEQPAVEQAGTLEAHEESQQARRRRSSGLPQFHDRTDDTATTLYSSDSEPADVVEEIASDEEEEVDSNSDSADDGTMMTMVTEEVTGTTNASDRSDQSLDSEDEAESSTLDEVLRQAAHRAGMQDLTENPTAYGQNNDDYEEDDDEEVIPSFGWIKKPSALPTATAAAGGSDRATPAETDFADARDGDTQASLGMEMDMTSAVGGILKPMPDEEEEPEMDEDMSMDVTKVIGGILGQNRVQPVDDTPEAEDEEQPMEEATMELTTAIGGIRSAQHDDYETDHEGHEDMSMELTTVLGGVLGKNKRPTATNTGAVEDATMDMTTGFGRIVIESDRPENNDGESTMGMDVTTAIGGIIGSTNGGSPMRDLGRKIMVEEADTPNSPGKAIRAAVSQAPASRSRSPLRHDENNEDADPGLWAFAGQGLRRSIRASAAAEVAAAAPNSRTPSPEKSVTPRSRSRSQSTSPRKQVPAQQQRITRSATRSKSKSASPEKVSRQPSAEVLTPSPTKRPRRRSSIVSNAVAGTPVSQATLTPQRPLTGVGVDRSGLGSPKVAVLLDRRESLGNAATDFVPGTRAVTFQDPRDLVEQVDRERQEEFQKEDDHTAGQDSTFNLRGMIDSLSPNPKRMPLKGRKSLHVGSANGLLGKRPAELDDDDDSEAEPRDGVKRLKGHQGSPVKNVRLQNPPSRTETTGGLLRSSQLNLEQPETTPLLSSPAKNGQSETPRHQLRFKEAEEDPTTREVDFHHSPVKDAAQLARAAEEGRIHLQDFLNMTSIRFMELTTTKRRHTAAPASFKNGHLASGEEDTSLERYVVAGACTVPTLELYQHCCRELKKYISKGRRIVKDVEIDTFNENPPLFREYVTATPDVKALMDSQFKNVKTHARLLSKAKWYEWRMMVQDGLRQGLFKISEDMESDAQLLQKQTDLIASVLPELEKRHQRLLEESADLEEVAQELAESDPAVLEATREDLTELNLDIARKRKMIADLRQEYEESEAEVQLLSEKKDSCLAEISQSERIREACRGWTSADIETFKERVEAITQEHGWAVTGITGTNFSMAYKGEVQLDFDTATLQSASPDSRLEIRYIGDQKEYNAVAQTPEKEAVLHCIRNQVRAMQQDRTSLAKVLSLVAAGWHKAQYVGSQLRRINTTLPTTVEKGSDTNFLVKTSILLVPLETRVEVVLSLHGRDSSERVDFDIRPLAKVVYGEHFNEDKINEYLTTRLGEYVGALEEDWSDILIELRDRLIARGQKQ